MRIKRVAIAGSTGYSGQELTRLLKHHSHLLLTRKISRDENFDSIEKDVDLAFLCTPNEVSLEMAPKLLAKGVHVVDVSGVFRLKKHAYPEWYGLDHTQPDLLAKAEYALNPWIKIPAASTTQGARLIANPGCYPTASLLGVLPLVKEGLVKPNSLVLDAKSGTTGAGKKAEARLMFSEIFGDFAPYKVGRHQHWPEIVEATEMFTGVKTNPCFTTSLLPVDRGISVAIFGEWTDAIAQRSPDARLALLEEAYRQAYHDQPDIEVGRDPQLAVMKRVVGTNRAHIQVNEAFGRPVVFVVIDNLVRGAACQALMNANRLAGLDPQEGLS